MHGGAGLCARVHDCAMPSQIARASCTPTRIDLLPIEERFDRCRRATMLALSATAVQLLAVLQSTKGSSSADGCRWDGVGHDFFSHNESNSLGTTASGSNEREMDTSCCRQCRARPGCTFWVRSTTNNHCWLKSNFSHFGVNPQRRGNFLGSLPPLPPPPPLPTNPTQVTVFEAGMGGFTCFRIPTLHHER